jgi:hypothetical protein
MNKQLKNRFPPYSPFILCILSDKTHNYYVIKHYKNILMK